MYTNKRTGKQATIVKTEHMRRGDLYTIQYTDGSYARYYNDDFERKFEAKSEPKRDNVIFVDFINKCKIA